MIKMLKQKTPLRAKTGLKTYKPLQAKTGLKAKQSLRDSYAAKIKSGEKSKPKVSNKVYKPKHKYFSVLQPDLTVCYVTGYTKASGADIHVHHVFGGANKAKSEKYGFLIGLRADWHDMADYGIHFDREFELRIKRLCQDIWLEIYGTKEEFIAEFGKWW
jgi:hypothetical protein